VCGLVQDARDLRMGLPTSKHLPFVMGTAYPPVLAHLTDRRLSSYGENACTMRLALDVDIRPATTHDLPALATWSSQVEQVFRPALELEDRVLLVAHANGRFPIGHVLVDRRGIISHLLVLAGFRGQGLGSALLDEAEALLRDTGHATLMVEKVNEGAIRLYERRGYVRTGDAVETWPEPMPDRTMQPVDHPSWVMRKEL
jgi:GNAT superfamily N-acetyltransferase